MTLRSFGAALALTVVLPFSLAACPAAKECPACSLTCPEPEACPGCSLTCPQPQDCPACNVTCPAPPSSSPTLVTSYSQLMSALKTGQRVRIVLDYARCTLEGAPGPAAVGGMNIDTFEWFDTGVVGNRLAYVTFSETKLIKFGGYKNNYVKVRVFADESVTVDAEYVDPNTFATTMQEQFLCTLTTVDTDPKGASLWSD